MAALNAPGKCTLKYSSATAKPRPPFQSNKLLRSPNLPKKYPKAAVPEETTHQTKYHPCMYKDLQRFNYQLKFKELIKCEENTHREILDSKCSQICTLILDDPPKEDNQEGSYEQYAYLKGLNDDQIAYVTQSADKRGVIIKVASTHSKTEICRASILRRNFSHTEDKLYIAFDEKNYDKIELRYGRTLNRNQSVPVYVDFKLKFWYFNSLTKAVTNVSNDIIAKVMPDSDNFSDFELCDLDECELKGNYSKDQVAALKTIISCPATGPPCLIMGPFGTGKSHLLATAADYFFQQNKLTKLPARILVCTQQRESADNFFQLYHDLMTLDKDANVFIVRDYGFHVRSLKKRYKTTEELKNLISPKVIKGGENYLVIMPCLTTPRVAEFLPSEFFTHIFIDEGAQMREPEAIAPLCMATKHTKIVIAGDHLQVGPSMLVLGQVAHKNGLSCSLLERLLNHYQLHGFNKLICKLDHCHRCHEEILKLSTQLFYKTPLVIPDDEPTPPPHPDYQYPCAFICSSVDTNVIRVMSMKDENEANVVLEIAQDIGRHWPKRIWGKSHLSQMCIISPSRSQLSLINCLIQTSEQFSLKLKEMRRVPTYFVQGKEYRVLVLSTSEPITENGSSANPTKSLCEPYVFNTAITRAESLVVAVGNPFLLLEMEKHMVNKYGEIGKCWSNYFKCCLEHSSLSVARMLNLPKDAQKDILMKIKDQAERQLQQEIQFPPNLETEAEHTHKLNVSDNEISAEVDISEATIIMDDPGPTFTTSTNDHISSETQFSSSGLQNALLNSTDPKQPFDTNSEQPPTLVSVGKSKFQLIGSLGGGGFGYVFHVKNTFDKASYALKIVPLPDEEQKQQKLLREVHALAQLQDSHIVQYFSSWSDKAPKSWDSKEGWKEMKKTFISVARRTTSSSNPSHVNTAVQGIDLQVQSESACENSLQRARQGQTLIFPNILSKSDHSSSTPFATKGSNTSQAVLDELLENPPTCLFIQMELCKHQTLSDWLYEHRKENSRQKKEIVDYFEQMLSALEYIHKEGYIHRDLKPTNIFFSQKKNVVKIGDFGLVTTDVTTDHSGVAYYRTGHGTRAYASPEQREGATCDCKTDIFTLGLIFFELHHITSHANDKSKAFEALRRKGEFPKTFEDKHHNQVAELIRKMIKRDPHERPHASEIINGDTLKALKKKISRTKQPYIPVL